MIDKAGRTPYGFPLKKIELGTTQITEVFVFVVVVDFYISVFFCFLLDSVQRVFGWNKTKI